MRYNIILKEYTQELDVNEILEHVKEALRQGSTITINHAIYSPKVDYEDILFTNDRTN
jgi:hypothetical protein